MKKWLAGLAATIISGIVIYWFTVGFDSLGQVFKADSSLDKGETIGNETFPLEEPHETLNHLDSKSQNENYSSGGVENYIKQLKKGSVSSRMEAADNLRKMGKSAGPAFPSLVEALNENNMIMLQKVVDALISIDPVKARPHLAKLSDDLYEQRGGGTVDGTRPEDDILMDLIIFLSVEY